MSKYLTEYEACKYLRVTPSSLKLLALTDDAFPEPSQIGDELVWDRELIDLFVASLRQRSESVQSFYALGNRCYAKAQERGEF